MSTVQPPPIVPPVYEPDPPPPPSPPQKPKGPIGRALSAIGAFLVAVGKWLYPAFKLLKFGKIFLTMGTMLLSIWFYSIAFGWPFAVGFVVLILVHEMGHVFVAWRQGLEITAPIFLPGMGAIILSKRFVGNAWSQAIMGIGGPVAGAISSVVCVGIYLVTHNGLFAALAISGFFINLFNLLPVPPLDGGWITGAVSPLLWGLGLVALLAMTIAGYMTNPLVWILVILSLPRLWTAWTHRKDPEYQRLQATPRQRVVMGVCYLSLAAFLLFGMGATVMIIPKNQPLMPTRRHSNQVAQRDLFLPRTLS